MMNLHENVNKAEPWVFVSFQSAQSSSTLRHNRLFIYSPLPTFHFICQCYRKWALVAYPVSESIIDEETTLQAFRDWLNNSPWRRSQFNKEPRTIHSELSNPVEGCAKKGRSPRRIRSSLRTLKDSKQRTQEGRWPKHTSLWGICLRMTIAVAASSKAEMNHHAGIFVALRRDTLWPDSARGCSKSTGWGYWSIKYVDKSHEPVEEKSR